MDFKLVEKNVMHMLSKASVNPTRWSS